MTLIQPSGELELQIRKSFNEDVKTRDRDLEIIKEWLRQEPHLPNQWDEKRMMTFLRGCNFSLERTKRKLDLYFTMRAAVPEFFANRDITRPELQELLTMGELVALPGLTPDGRRILSARAITPEFDTPDFANLAKLVFMLGDIRLEAEKTGVEGDVYILDGSVASIKHFANVSPAVIKKFLICAQEAYPVKLKEIHVINITPFIEIVMGTVKPFLKEKIRNRIHFHSNLESLHKYISKELLPEEYGGYAGSLSVMAAEWIKTMKEYQPWFDQQENIKADEAKRLGKPKNDEELFGVDGSFKKLNID